jgi:hypothetical protein
MSVRACLFPLAAAAALAGVFASAAPAATIDFSGDKTDPYLQDGFSLAPIRIVNGNCLDNACMALNDNETTTLTSADPSSLFTLTGLSFNLLGNGTGNFLQLVGSNGTSLVYSVAEYAKNTYHTLVFGDEFADVSSVVFSTGRGGNVRVDAIGATPAPVPLPAAAWLLIGGIGTLVAARRRARPAA